MKKIGITGGMGSGKTTVCGIFELLGIPVYYSDEESKKILSRDESVKKELLTIFGNDILDNNARIDRKKLAALAFSNKSVLEKLNAVLHPAVGRHFEEWLSAQKAAYIIKEAAILFESGAYKQVEKVITVVAPLELRIKRILKRDNTSEAEVLQRIGKQMSDEEKIKRSDLILMNDEKELLIPQILKIHAELLSY
jgi:dephospho-CoA kinase